MRMMVMIVLMRTKKAFTNGDKYAGNRDEDEDGEDDNDEIG